MKKSRKPRLLLITSNDSLGGSERLAISLARALVACGWDVHYAFPKTADSGQLEQWCRDADVDGAAHPEVLTLLVEHSFHDMLAFRRFIRERKPDVVNLQYGSNFIPLRDMLAARLAGAYRLVVTINHPVEWEGWRRRVATGVAALLCPAIVVICRATCRILAEAGVPLRKVRVIYPGLQPPAATQTRVEARARLGLAPDAFVISTLARLVSEKGIADLIEAVARVPDPDGKLVLLVAGDGPERCALERLAVSLLGDRASFLGFVPDNGDLFAAADVFALPSYMEGFGLVYLEAAFYGIPSIGSNVGGIPDAVVDGETGLLVPVHDPVALAAAIQKLRDDPALRLRLGEAARTRACGFTEATMAQQYVQVFQRW